MNAKFNVKDRLNGYIRILKMTERPNWDEFKTTSKVTGLSLFIIGLIGFGIYLALSFLI
ncbi:MAG TPA: protein translocase SEC61 complex subunit gamma [Halobacteria archaeon]|jgi:protein translocase SEC61 complex gamma subunit|nr:protein translocase SEC61 complex subunit gamma [Halobacteria archaeon]